jgi:multiple sugar transport system substrate-binding protein
VERGVLRRQVQAFNASHQRVQATLITLPQGDYNGYVRSAAASGNLPDVLDFDGPNLYNYAWSGRLKPIDSCMSGDLRADLLPSLIKQGTYAGRTWGLGTFDSGLGLYVRPSILERAGIRIPSTPDQAWTVREFGDLIDRHDYRTSDGVLNGPAAVKAMSTLQRWVKNGYVDPDRDGQAFEKSRAPISWGGHWLYEPYRQASGGDLAIVPLPDFGKGTVTGMGSWQWGITASATDGDAAWQFLSFLLAPHQILGMTRANGAIPATQNALRRSPRFAAGGPEHLYYEQLESAVARPRPQTPAYPAITDAFRRATDRILLADGPVKPTLDAAVRRIDRDLAEHGHYHSTEP